MLNPIPVATPTQIRHRHDLHHQTRPSRKMLRSLPSARFRVILLPREARPLPFIEDVFDEVLAKGGVDFGCLGLVRAGLDCDVLGIVSGMFVEYLKATVLTDVEAFYGEVVHVHPYRTSPVVLVCPIEFIAHAQTS